MRLSYSLFTFRIFGKKLIGGFLPGLWLGFKQRLLEKMQVLESRLTEAITSSRDDIIYRITQQGSRKNAGFLWGLFSARILGILTFLLCWDSLNRVS
ncbi:hypothetical protein [Candidatus Vallotia tarda]|uniref:hypothetical protein n=1 Tax=Candidatus Vallotiella hemipterorum TaxID=1177213 RepID=UPI001C3E85B7|nr:hypothetical protein [Candidatus Vallotia tarda]